MSNKKQFTFNLKDNPVFKKDEMNFFNELGSQQLPVIGNLYMLDVYLSADNCIELHYHYNSSELVYVISGEVEVGFLNADTNEWQTFRIGRGEAISIPQGWWHYVCALKNHTHFLAIFDTRDVKTIFGSDILWKTPDRTFAHIYCLDEEKVKEALSPIDETVVIGPPLDCHKGMKRDGEIPSSRNINETNENIVSENVPIHLGEKEKEHNRKKTDNIENLVEQMKTEVVQEPNKKLQQSPYQRMNLAGASGQEAEHNHDLNKMQQEQYDHWQSMLELEQQQMMQPIGYYGNVMPFEICQICLGYRY